MRYLTDPNGTQKNMRAAYVNCPDCAHCQDLKVQHPDDPAALTEVQEHVKTTIIGWMDLIK